MEKNQEEEGVLPSNWVKGDMVYWPPVVNARTMHAKRVEPDRKKWLKFKLVKIKHSSGNFTYL